MSNKREVWKLYTTAKTTKSRPSSLVGVSDAWAAFQFDNAVSFVGTTIENASQEMVEVGIGKSKKMQPKYHLDQLLDDDFRLPRPESRKERERKNVQAFLSMIRAASHGGRAKIDKVS